MTLNCRSATHADPTSGSTCHQVTASLVCLVRENPRDFTAGIPLEALVPVLFVGDVAAEKDFYQGLGFTVTYEGPDFPSFVALRHGDVEFAVKEETDFDRDVPRRMLRWQFRVRDVDQTKAVLDAIGIEVHVERVTPRPDWHYRILRVETPNGYVLAFEGGNEAVNEPPPAQPTP